MFSILAKALLKNNSPPWEEDCEAPLEAETVHIFLGLLLLLAIERRFVCNDRYSHEMKFDFNSLRNRDDDNDGDEVRGRDLEDFRVETIAESFIDQFLFLISTFECFA
jgi:hypothetical protein